MSSSSAPASVQLATMRRGVMITLVVAAVYFVSAHLGTFWTTAGRTSSPIFPGVGTALAVLLLYGRHYWPTILVGRLLAFWLADAEQSTALMVAIAGGNAFTAWLGSWLVTHWGRLDPALTRLRDVLWLGLGGGITASVVGATLGASAMWLGADVPTTALAGTWLRWWLGSVGGVLVVTPLALAWGTGEPVPRTSRYWLPLLGCVAVTSAISAWVFLGSRPALGMTWMVFPALLWSSLAFGVRGATLALLPATVIGVAGASMGVGILSRTFDADVSYVLLQQFVTAASFTCLVLAVVADERRGKQALRDREHRLHLALAAARSFGFEFDRASDRVERTSECAEILGLPPDEAERGSARAFIARVHEDDRQQFIDVLAAVTPQQPAAKLAYRFTRADGRLVHIEESCTATFDAEGTLTGLVGVAMDVTERRLAEQERESLLKRERAARQEAEQAMLLRDEFLGTVSHELRTPLNAILGWAQILQSGPRTADALQSGLATIARNARLQTQLIDDLLDLSRLGGGRLRLDAQPIDVVGVVRDAVLAVTPAASARDVRLYQEAPSGPLLVTGDAERLQQVFWNLLVNAVKFTEPGGKIRVQVDQVEGRARIRVNDTGKGIAADFLPHVFDRFRQADGSTTRRHSGLGIGLALVRQLVEMHGGAVSAESRGEGLGATFTVELPSLRTGPHAVPSHTGTPSPVVEPHRGITVLVVDDDPDAREVCSHLLEASGARVLTAAGADDGLHLVRSEHPDVLVADIGMPGVDGYAFIKAVRALPPDEGADIPAVALTALVRDEDRTRAIEAGYQSHLAKPVNRDALLTTLSRLYPRRSRP
jgi:PAS domain S-box-containing protein